MNDNLLKTLNCIGILGGTFNPIHKGHTMLANEVIKQFPDIEKLLIMPNNMPAYKETEDIISTEHRLNMLSIATDSISKAYVSDMEIKRGGTTYTIDTLRQIRAINKDIKIYFVIGADSLYNIEKWREYQDIFDNCTIVAAKRDCHMEDIISFSEKLKAKYPKLDIEFLHTQAVDISSSQLRENISNNILEEEFLDEDIINYIKTNKLYGWKP